MANILIVDDDMPIRLLFSDELKADGFETYMAANGFEALEIVGKIPINLVILDIKMPEMDGIETLRHLKTWKPELPIILCTAYGEYKQDFATWASDAYLVKSSDVTDLKLEVKKHINEGIATSPSAPLNEVQVMELITNEIKILINEKEKNKLEHLQKLCRFYDIRGFLKVFPKEKITSYFEANLKEFNIELTKAQTYIRESILKGFNIKEIYRPKNWSVLRESRFMDESRKILHDLEEEGNWLSERLESIVEMIKTKKFSAFPFEQLKDTLLRQTVDEEANKEISGLFMADIRHDLRNVIRKLHIKGGLKDECQALETILKRLYSIAFLEVRTHFAFVDLKDFLTELIGSISAGDGKDIKMELASEELQWLTDVAVLGVALRQIIKNAMEAIPTQGAISVSAIEKENVVKITIADTGCGIPAELLGKIFEPGFSHNKQNNTGMGLTLARYAIKTLGGEISIASKLKQGTSVEIFLPKHEGSGSVTGEQPS